MDLNTQLHKVKYSINHSSISLCSFGQGSLRKCEDDVQLQTRLNRLLIPMLLAKTIHTTMLKMLLTDLKKNYDNNP